MTERLTLNDWIESERATDPDFRAAFDAGAQRDALVRTLVDVRKRLGISQQELAKRTGLTASALSRMEAGAVDPRWSTIARVAHALGARVELTIDDQPLAG
jgi:DNA-binding XRE family transcriptional regulator